MWLGTVKKGWFMEYISEEDFEVLVSKVSKKMSMDAETVRKQAINVLLKKRIYIGEPPAPIKIRVESVEGAVEGSFEVL